MPLIPLVHGRGVITELQGPGRAQARRFKPVLTAEVENRERFETGTFLGKTQTREDLNWKFRNLKDGEAFTKTDHFDYEFDISDLVYRGLTGDRDFALAFGRNELKSTVIFTARRVGDLIYIEGTVTHAWEHVYGFEPGQPASEFALAAKAHAGAADFRYGATWFQRFGGTVRIVDGTLTDPQFAWTDVDARDRM